MNIKGKEAKEGDVWASKNRRTTIKALFTKGARWRVRYAGTTGAESEAWADVYLRNRVLVERDGKPVTAGAVPGEQTCASYATAARSLFDYRAELLRFDHHPGPTPSDLEDVNKARALVVGAVTHLATVDLNGLVDAVISACANSVDRAGLRSLGTSLLLGTESNIQPSQGG